MRKTQVIDISGKKLYGSIDSTIPETTTIPLKNTKLPKNQITGVNLTPKVPFFTQIQEKIQKTINPSILGTTQIQSKTDLIETPDSTTLSKTDIKQLVPSLPLITPELEKKVFSLHSLALNPKIYNFLRVNYSNMLKQIIIKYKPTQKLIPIYNFYGIAL